MSAYYVADNKESWVEVSGLKVLKRGKHPNEWSVIAKSWDWKLDETGALYVRFREGAWLKVQVSSHAKAHAG